MAINVWQDVNDTLDATANWSLGSAMADTNDARFLSGSKTIVNNLDQRSVADVDLASLLIGGAFVGSIGTETAAMKLDDISGTLEVDVSGINPQQIINLDIDSCPTAIIRNTGSHKYACYLSAANAGYTTVYVTGGQSIYIGAITIGTLVVVREPGKPSPTIRLASGASITTIDAQDGLIISEAALATVKLRGTAQLHQIGSATGNITTELEVSENAYALLGGITGFTVTLASTYGKGRIETNRPDLCSAPWTFTNARARGGAIITKKIDIFSNAPVEVGGMIPGVATTSIIAPGVGGVGVFAGGK